MPELASKRDQARLERRLVVALTQACETAKAELPGFDWLTHLVDYQAFPHSLRVVWVFDTQANQAQALATGLDARMRELTAQALGAAEVTLDARQLARCVRVDSQQQCQAQQAGDWPARLARLHAAKG
ncbi:hypothetical protein [Pseudomonas abieticivorans]|uniref:hypothetical protein n=1 Tax=Pseudomonas abieticivorans TaxID=2931382 RepID=UPI003F693B29